MKRTLFIIGLLIILLLTGVLLFLLFANDQQKQEIFSAFNFGDTTDPTAPIETIVDALTGEDKPPLFALRQLTLKRVIGEVEAEISTSTVTHVVYYAEAGTGHIYSLDINTGTETRLSNITIATANRALITATGTFAAIASSESGEGSNLTIVTLPKNQVTLTSGVLAEKVKDFSLSENGVLRYTTVAGETLTARKYDANTKVTSTLFTLPFKDATVRFVGDGAFVYPKPAPSLEGYVYEVSGGVLNRLPISGYALNAIADANSILYSATNKGSYTSGVYNITNRKTVPVSFGVISEKCVFVPKREDYFCGIDASTNSDALFKWYKGATMSTDDLWLIDAASGETTLLVSPQEAAGRAVDVIKPVVSPDGDRYYFINKLDNTLWVFDTDLANS